MIALLAPLLLKVGIPAKLHKAALIGAAVIALLVGFGLWLHFHDNAVRKADRNAAEAVVAKTILDAERAANRADATRQAENQANDAETRKAIDDAAAKEPEKARAAAGPASNAAARSLRERQGRPKPAAS